MSSNAYNAQGSTLKVGASGSAKTITGISKANPAVVTSTAHGLTEGQVLKIASVAGMTEINNKVGIVRNPAANTFELAGVDSSAFTTYTSGGSVAIALVALLALAGVLATGCKSAPSATALAVVNGTEIPKSAVDTQSAFKVTSNGLTLGTDYRFEGNHVLGAALGLLRGQAGNLRDGPVQALDEQLHAAELPPGEREPGNDLLGAEVRCGEVR